jgi:hypothetical protein
MLVYWFSERNNNTDNYILMYSSHSLLIHSVVCLTTGPKPLPTRDLHIVRSRASSFKWEYPLLSLRSSSSLLSLLLRLPVTYIPSFTFSSITCFRRQFLRKTWPIQIAFRFLISCKIFLCSLTLSNTSSFLTWSVQLIYSMCAIRTNKMYFFLSIYFNIHPLHVSNIVTIHHSDRVSS